MPTASPQRVTMQPGIVFIESDDRRRNRRRSETRDQESSGEMGAAIRAHAAPVARDLAIGLVVNKA
jgi:hypothetical protein